MMSQRKQWLFIMILGLLVLNLWQWWPGTEQSIVQAAQQKSSHIHVNDLKLSAYAVNEKGMRKVQRDLFVMPEKQRKRVITDKPSAAKNRTTTRPEQSAEVVKLKQVQSDLNRFKLVGVLFKNGEKSAYLVNGDKDYSVKKGDKIDGRYLVEEVTVSTITLLESNTQQSSIVYMQ